MTGGALAGWMLADVLVPFDDQGNSLFWAAWAVGRGGLPAICSC